MILSAIGLFIAGVLSYSHYFKVQVPCKADALVSCSQLISSPAGYVGKVPVAYIGFGGYLFFMILSLLRSNSVAAKWQKLTTIGVFAAGFGTAYSFYLQAFSFQNQVPCPWCIASAITMICIFLVHGMLARLKAPAMAPEGKLDFTLAAAGAILAIGAVGVTGTTMKSATAMEADFSGVKADMIHPGDERIKGDPDAKVILVEFADINCPSCRVSKQVIEKIFQRFEGKMAWGFRHFPLFSVPGHETSAEAAMMAQFAATKGKYWDFLDNVFKEGNTERVKTQSGLLQVAIESGLDPDELQEAIKDLNGPLFDQVNEDFEMAQVRLKLDGTPAFILLAEGVPPRTVGVNEIEPILSKEPYKSLMK
ncbi:thioredoxin domain-containing protein [Geitlerinema splendidum]|nr:thioredoxin domain-containing protein [Geitlerinema splendidum]